MPTDNPIGDLTDLAVTVFRAPAEAEAPAWAAGGFGFGDAVLSGAPSGFLSALYRSPGLHDVADTLRLDPDLAPLASTNEALQPMFLHESGGFRQDLEGLVGE